MKSQIPNCRSQIEIAGERRSAAIGNSLAFSLIEILVVVALLSFIILGLLAMFSQTQRAFRSGMTQVDVLGGGRVVAERLAREFEQICPSYQNALNFYARIPYDSATYRSPFLQPLPGSASTDPYNQRMNLIEDVFFLTRKDQNWTAIGYFVRVNPNPAANLLSLSGLGAGTLYRFETNLAPFSTPARTVDNLFAEFSNARLNESRASKIMDGVIHFKVRAFDTNGFWVTNNIGRSIDAKYDNYKSADVRGELELYEFASNAVPATVELEIGILEDRVWQRYKALPTFLSQSNYLSNQSGRVHLFRQRIAVRNVDPLAYQ